MFRRLFFTLLAAGCVFLQPNFPGTVRAQSAPVLSLLVTSAVPVIQISGASGSPCVLQFSTNLAGGWQTMSNFALAGGQMTVTDPARATNLLRFYRAAVLAPTNAAWIPAGTFTMGSPTNELLRINIETQHVVTLTKSFYVAKFPVTQQDYQTLMGVNPSYYTPANGFAADLSRPVEQVSWSDATNYCAKLTQQERAAGRILTNWLYRLPTEAEWEYACRAGTATPFYTGTNLLAGMANFNVQYEYVGGVGLTNASSGTFLNRPSTVGSYPANAFGLSDMAGNVWEWCADWFGSYSTNSVVDPQGPASGTARVFRGGAFNATGADCRSARRNSVNPSTAVNTIGFRVVLSAP
ncbi:MAG: formylglycine-generating enzyme family protein [Verrucomicrobiota bacterium]